MNRQFGRNYRVLKAGYAALEPVCFATRLASPVTPSSLSTSSCASVASIQHRLRDDGKLEKGQLPGDEAFEIDVYTVADTLKARCARSEITFFVHSSGRKLPVPFTSGLS